MTFPFGYRGGVEDLADFLEGQAGLLQHANEDESAQSLGSVAALAGLASVWAEQPLTFVVADGGGGHLSAFSHLADGEQVGHGTYLT